MGEHAIYSVRRRQKAQEGHDKEAAQLLRRAWREGSKDTSGQLRSSVSCPDEYDTFKCHSRCPKRYGSLRPPSAKELGLQDVEQDAAVTGAPQDRAALDAWSDVAAPEPDISVCEGLCGDIEALSLQPEANAGSDAACAVEELRNCLQRMHDSVADDMEVLCRGVATHCAGAAAASSFPELQDHISELVQLSGPEVSCAWSTVKVGLGVASVLSGNLMIGSFMVALAVGSLGTSIIWKVHRDSQRSAFVLQKVKSNSPHLESCCSTSQGLVGQLDHFFVCLPKDAAYKQLDKKLEECVQSPQTIGGSESSPIREDPAGIDAWSD
ncbi:hypothetical protein Efla_006276 [Eimeria flavescens]